MADLHKIVDLHAAPDASLANAGEFLHRPRQRWRDSHPTCTRLSIFTPRRMRVSPTLARSIQEFACTSTSSSITTGAGCGILCQRPSGVLAKPKPSDPITTPLCSNTLLPMRQFSRTTACACRSEEHTSELQS